MRQLFVKVLGVKSNWHEEFYICLFIKRWEEETNFLKFKRHSSISCSVDISIFYPLAHCSAKTTISDSLLCLQKNQRYSVTDIWICLISDYTKRFFLFSSLFFGDRFSLEIAALWWRLWLQVWASTRGRRNRRPTASGETP